EERMRTISLVDDTIESAASFAIRTGQSALSRGQDIVYNMRIGDGHTGGGRDSHVSSHVAGFSPQMSGSKPDHPGSGGVPNSGGGRQRICYNCGKSGHLAASCFEVLGYPDWYPRGGAGRRGGRRGRGGRGGGAPAQANVAATTMQVGTSSNAGLSSSDR
ncbi:zinc knuckle (CCHC-type) family protein, partial [Striga asiatica]